VEEQKEPAEFSVSTNLVRFGPYLVDRRAGEVCKHNQRIRLSGQPFEVLSMLLERSLNSAVKKLRRALNDDPQSPRYIETLPRKGYRFIGTIEPLTVTEPTSGDERGDRASSFLTPDLPNGPLVPADNGAIPQHAESVRNRNKWMIAIGVAALLAIGSFVIYRPNRKPRVAGVVVPPKSLNFRSSIAVLGFKNLSSGRDADWLSTAFTRMLSTELAAGDKIRIIPEETVTRAKIDLGLQEKNGYPRDALRRAISSSLRKD
jgi:DNA-binding winged helix-turn-helix (wHTH) protein